LGNQVCMQLHALEERIRQYISEGRPITIGIDKQPLREGWNQHPLSLEDALETINNLLSVGKTPSIILLTGMPDKGGGYLAHIDVDDISTVNEEALNNYNQQGIVNIVQTRKNRLRIELRLERPLPYVKIPTKHGQIELLSDSRGAVLPPSINTETGEPRRWEGRYTPAPELPILGLNVFFTIVKNVREQLI